MTEAPPAAFVAPEVLTTDHDLSAFASGEPPLDEWLRERALENMRLGASRTYVSRRLGERRVAAYYALAMGGVVARQAPGSMRRNMPQVIPSVILGRLAVDRECHGMRLGGQILQDAVHRSVRAATEVSARLLVVHALSPAAEAFYRHHGFVKLLTESPTLALDLAKVARALSPG